MSLYSDGLAMMNSLHRCAHCQQQFTDANVYTVDGIKEIAISQVCERCFDEIFEEDDDD